MRQISEFPRVELGVLPTPLYKLENLSRETGKNIYIKRDDMIGVALGLSLIHIYPDRVHPSAPAGIRSRPSARW